MRILIALDGSELAKSPLKSIGPWAEASGAEVVLLTVLQASRIHETASASGGHVTVPQGTPSGLRLRTADPERIPAEDRTQALERARAEAEAGLHESALALLPRVRTDIRVDWAEDVPQAIARAAEEAGADFFAMGTHGRKGIAHALLGSVAEAVLRASSVPVLLVREGMRIPAGS